MPYISLHFLIAFLLFLISHHSFKSCIGELSSEQARGAFLGLDSECPPLCSVISRKFERLTPELPFDLLLFLNSFSLIFSLNTLLLFSLFLSQSLESRNHLSIDPINLVFETERDALGFLDVIIMRLYLGFCDFGCVRCASWRDIMVIEDSIRDVTVHFTLSILEFKPTKWLLAHKGVLFMSLQRHLMLVEALFSNLVHASPFVIVLFEGFMRGHLAHWRFSWCQITLLIRRHAVLSSVKE